METKHKKLRNPLAFPNENSHERGGMTLRDYFAAKAMQSMINDTGWKTRQGMTYQQDISENAYLLADAMLKQREL